MIWVMLAPFARMLITLALLGVLLHIGGRAVARRDTLSLMVAVVAGQVAFSLFIGALSLAEGVVGIGTLLWIHALGTALSKTWRARAQHTQPEVDA